MENRLLHNVMLPNARRHESHHRRVRFCRIAFQLLKQFEGASDSGRVDFSGGYWTTITVWTPVIVELTVSRARTV